MSVADIASAPCRILVVDDEPLARATLCGWIEKFDPSATVTECESGTQAVAALNTGAFDLAFLDVQMPDVDGFAVVRRVGVENMPVTVFVTAWQHYALDAFRARALDYLLKPIDDQMLESAYTRARDRLRLQHEFDGHQAQAAQFERDAYPAAPSSPLQYLTIRTGELSQLVATDRIDFIEAADDYVYIHVQGTRHLVRNRMAFFEERLDPRRFVRIHRSTIVNLDRVQGFLQEPDGSHTAMLHDGARLRVSRTRRGVIEARLGQPLRARP